MAKVYSSAMRRLIPLGIVLFCACVPQGICHYYIGGSGGCLRLDEGHCIAMAVWNATMVFIQFSNPICIGEHTDTYRLLAATF